MNRRRLGLESLRDSVLAVSGRLDESIGGTPVKLTEGPSLLRRTLNGRIERQNLPAYVVMCPGGYPIQESQNWQTEAAEAFDVSREPQQVHDLHATILRLMGFDHERFTYRYAGRYLVGRRSVCDRALVDCPMILYWRRDSMVLVHSGPPYGPLFPLAVPATTIGATSRHPVPPAARRSSHEIADRCDAVSVPAHGHPDTSRGTPA